VLRKVDRQSQSEKILSAAYGCISTRGYANVSLRDIAEEAGVALSQLHYYYKSKEGLFKEVVQSTVGKYLREVEHALKNGNTLEERTTSLIDYFRKMLRHNPELFRLLYDFTGLALWSSAFSGLLRDLFRDLGDMFENHLLDCSQAELVRVHSAKALSRLVVGGMFGTGIQVLLDYEEDLPEALDAMRILLK
jgi:AcrR family transcriptional regulator